MARGPIYLEVKNDTTGAPVSGATVTVKKRSDATNATLYAAETGGTTTANPLTTDSKGRALGWADPDFYNLVVAGTGVTGYTVPYDATVPLKDASVTTLQVADATLLDTDLASPNNDMWIMRGECNVALIGGNTYTNGRLTATGIINSPNSYGSLTMHAMHIDPNDYDVAGKTTYWRLSAAYGVNAVQTGVTGTIDLVRHTSVTAVSTDFGWGGFAGPLGTVSIPNAINNSVGTAVSSDFTLSTAGVHGFVVSTSGAVAATSRMNITVTLSYRHA